MALTAQWITLGYKFCKQIIRFHNLIGAHTGKDISTDYLGGVNEFCFKSKMMTLRLYNTSSKKLAVGHIP